MKRAHWLGFGTAVSMIGVPLLSTFAAAAQGADPDDIASLNVAIALERAGIKAYADAAATNLLSPGVLTLARGFAADHMAHRDALIGAVRAAGLEPTTQTAVIPYPPLATERDIIAFANTVELKAASTYLSVVPELHDRRLAQVAAAILGVETTHVALLSQALGRKTYPSGFVV